MAKQNTNFLFFFHSFLFFFSLSLSLYSTLLYFIILLAHSHTHNRTLQLIHDYTLGDTCRDVEGKPQRSARVSYHCDVNRTVPAMGVHEVEPCQYSMQIHTALVCELEGLREVYDFALYS